MEFVINNKVKNNHYAIKYENFIKSRIELNTKRTLKKGEYEKHHIIPKSLGGSNCTSNLIKLTFREHYIAHIMLFYTYLNISMTTTINYMTNRESLKHYNSKIYKKCKEDAIKKLSDYKKLNSTKGQKIHTEEFKNKMSNLRKGENNPFFNKTHSEETKKLISKKSKEQFKNNIPNNSKAISINGIIYTNLTEAVNSGLFNVSKSTIRRRVLCDDLQWKDWKYL